MTSSLAFLSQGRSSASPGPDDLGLSQQYWLQPNLLYQLPGWSHSVRPSHLAKHQLEAKREFELLIIYFIVCVCQQFSSQQLNLWEQTCITFSLGVIHLCPQRSRLWSEWPEGPFLKGNEVRWTRAGGKMSESRGVFGVKQRPNAEWIECKFLVWNLAAWSMESIFRSGFILTSLDSRRVNRTFQELPADCWKKYRIGLVAKNGYQRENGEKENKRKTKTDNAGLDDDRHLRKAEIKAPRSGDIIHLNPPDMRAAVSNAGLGHERGKHWMGV